MNSYFLTANVVTVCAMRKNHNFSSRIRTTASAVALVKSINHGVPASKRTRGVARTLDQGPFIPTEDWYEPGDRNSEDYQVVHQSPGPGYRHAVTPRQVRQRLSELPEWMLDQLEVVQLSRMTRKKQTFPCYGMQWARTLYLYPIEESLVEVFYRPPKPSVMIESRQFGGRWEQEGSEWRLCWTEKTLRDFYLNNILIHELGHLLDSRNSSYVDRERYAEWFALEYGYKSTLSSRREKASTKRRHHSD